MLVLSGESVGLDVGRAGAWEVGTVVGCGGQAGSVGDGGWDGDQGELGDVAVADRG